MARYEFLTSWCVDAPIERVCECGRLRRGAQDARRGRSAVTVAASTARSPPASCERLADGKASLRCARLCRCASSEFLAHSWRLAGESLAF